MTKLKDAPAPIEAATDPFGKNVDSEHLFKHNQLEELRDSILSAVQKKTMALVTGPPGVGKTTGVRSVTDELPSHRYSTVYLGQDQSSVNVLRRFAHCLGMQPKHYRNRLSMQISEWLLENLSAGGKEIVLIVDEAHYLTIRRCKNFA